MAFVQRYGLLVKKPSERLRRVHNKLHNPTPTGLAIPSLCYGLTNPLRRREVQFVIHTIATGLKGQEIDCGKIVQESLLKLVMRYYQAQDPGFWLLFQLEYQCYNLFLISLQYLQIFDSS